MAWLGIYQKWERLLIKSFSYICKGLVLVHRHFMKPQNDDTKSLRASVSSTGALHMHEALRDFVHLGFCTRQNPAQSPGRYLQLPAKLNKHEIF